MLKFDLEHISNCQNGYSNTYDSIPIRNGPRQIGKYSLITLEILCRWGFLTHEINQKRSAKVHTICNVLGTAKRISNDKYFFSLWKTNMHVNLFRICSYFSNQKSINIFHSLNSYDKEKWTDRLAMHNSYNARGVRARVSSVFTLAKKYLGFPVTQREGSDEKMINSDPTPLTSSRDKRNNSFLI